MARAREHPPGPMAEFGLYLRRLREQSGLSWDEVAERASISRSTISRDENGDVPELPPERIRGYARVYRVPYPEILVHWIEGKFGIDFSCQVLVDVPSLDALHHDLERILNEADWETRQTVEGVIQLAVRQLPEPAEKYDPEAAPVWRVEKTVESEGATPEFDYRATAAVLPFTTFLDHDEPQELRMEELPFFDWAAIPASPPDFLEPAGHVTLPVLAHLAKGGRFVIRVVGDSMEPEIRNGDLIIVDGNLKYPKHGDTVVALINQKSTLKKFHRRARKITLLSLNPDHKDIPVTEEDEFQIQGVVVAITREMRR